MAEGSSDPSSSSATGEATNGMNIGGLPGLISGQSKSKDSVLLKFSEVEEPSCGEEKKNRLCLVCQFCKCKVLKPNFGILVEKEIFLPSMTEKHKIGEKPTGDTLTAHWLVQDMFHFENVGFSKTVEGNQYLLCADCEVGPIGWRDVADGNKLYVAAERVCYTNS